MPHRVFNKLAAVSLAIAWLAPHRNAAAQLAAERQPAALAQSFAQSFAQSKAAAALTQTLRNTHASAVVLDLQTGGVLASAGPPVRATPGSAIKPLLLQYALDHNLVRPETEVFCRRDLHIAGRPYPCTHPPDLPVFTAQSALAESCNTWFAELARRFPAPALEAALSETRLPYAPMGTADLTQRQLAVLGLRGVAATPLELARAYLTLLKQAPPNGPVLLGLRDSVAFGMANPAAVPGLPILGKTGTASNPGETQTHGWFAGALPGQLLIVLYLPHADGGAAARLAHRFFAAATLPTAPYGQPR
jgi:cell division protein FtsI/penicillin-binding protein 2